MTPQDFRALFLLDPETVFLNHGSFGACPRSVFERYQAWQLQLERQPVAFLDPDRGYGKWMAETRESLAAEIGAKPDDIAGCTNATHGLNIVARSLPLREGDEILTTRHEYAALEKTWDFVTRLTGARVVFADIPLPLTEAAQFCDPIIAAMTERTRVLFLSHITSPTALLFPIEPVVSEARRRGIFSVIDGAHAPGHIPLDLDRLGSDFYVGNCHKWMMAPKGAAFIHARVELQHLLHPLVISHGWQTDRQAPGPFGGTPFVDAMEMQGTRDPSAWLTVPEALRFRRDYLSDGVLQRCSDLAFATAERIGRMCGMEPISATAFSAPQMVSIPVPATDALALQRALHDQHRIEIPVVPWNGGTYVRLSVQCYNGPDEMDHLVGALAGLLNLTAAA